MNSLYVAVILYGGVRILDGLIVFALRFRPLSSLKAVQNHTSAIQGRAEKFTRFVALVLWLLLTLEFFTLRGIVFERISAVLTAELSLGSLGISAGDVLLFLFVVWAAFMLSRFIRFALEEEVYPRLPLAAGIPYAISTILNYVILLVGFLFAVAAAGLDLTRMTILVSAFRVGIGFGLQNVVNNFVSGLVLLFERPVRVGDEITVGDASGTVQRIGIRASLVKQWDNSEIIVPNSKLIAENVKNWTFSARTRGVEIPIRVAHGADTQLVAKLLTGTAAAHPLVAEDPEPQALLIEFAALSLNFKLRAWTTHVNRTTMISSELAIAVSRALTEHGVAFTQVSPIEITEK